MFRSNLRLLITLIASVSGFRYRFLKLKQNQHDLSVNGKYTIPEGIEFRYTSSCKYDSSSNEVSTTSVSRRSLQLEASLYISSAIGGGEGSSTIDKSFSARMSAEFSFSLSTKFSSTETSYSSQDSVSFESRALCSEYEASFNPYYL